MEEQTGKELATAKEDIRIPLRPITEILQDLYTLLRTTFPDHQPLLKETKFSKLLPIHSLALYLQSIPPSNKLKNNKNKNKNEILQFSSNDDERIQQLLQFGKETFHSLEVGEPSQLEKIRIQIEEKYELTLQDLPLFTHSETTLNVIAKMIQTHGKTPYRPILVDGMEVMKEIIAQQGYDNETMYIKSFRIIGDILLGKRKKRSLSNFSSPSEVMPVKWFEEHQIQANPQTHLFENDIGLTDHQMTRAEKNEHAYYSLQIFGVFFYLPLIAYLIFRFCSWSMILILFTSFLIYVYVPDYREFPPLFRRHIGFIYNIKYFSFKTIIEAPITAYEKIPSIYTFGPHGVFGTAPCLQTLVNAYLVGEHFHFLGANAVFLFPLYNMLLRMMGFDDISRETFTKLLQKQHSVGIIPGGIGEMFYSGNKIQDEVLMVRNRKGFIAIALETGAQIIPTYCFGSTQMFYVGSSKWLQRLSRLLKASIILFWGKYGLPIPLKVPMVCVLGTPIRCPKVENPSKELIEYYHTLYLQETQRLYQTYRNTYGWQNRNLVFKG